MEFNNLVCGVTAHRDIPDDNIEYIKNELRKVIQKTLDKNYRHYISGFANGGDLIFIETVLEFKERYPGIRIEAAIPYRERLKSKNKQFQNLIMKCDYIEICSEEYSKQCYSRRNDYILERSDLVIAIYDGRPKGGTYNTIQKAIKLNKNLSVIRY